MIGRANDSLWSCCGCWSLPRQEHIFKEGLQGECVSVYFDNQLTLCISVLSCVCRYLNTSGETQRRETLCLLEQLLEFQLLSERQSVKRNHHHHLPCTLTEEVPRDRSITAPWWRSRVFICSWCFSCSKCLTLNARFASPRHKDGEILSVWL